MSETISELLPCPFCGANDAKPTGSMSLTKIWCPYCNSHGPGIHHGGPTDERSILNKCEAEAIAGWNTRALRTSAAGAVKAEPAAFITKHGSPVLRQDFPQSWLDNPEAFGLTPLYSTLTTRDVTEQVTALPLCDWHEDMGDVVWWCWRDDAWLGEPAYIGSPLNLGYTVECHTQAQNGSAPAARFMVGGWPGYHTHWTPHPAFPDLRAALTGVK